MGKTRREQLREAKLAEEKKKRQSMLRTVGIIAASVAVVALVLFVVISEKRAHKNLSVALADDGSLHVERSDMGKGFNYVDWGGPEELILYTADDGSVRAAFDTCEECYDRGSVHFTRSESQMTCSVCGLVQDVADFGTQEWGGCRPVTVPDAARMDTDGEIVVSGEAVDYFIDMLAQWTEVAGTEPEHVHDENGEHVETFEVERMSFADFSAEADAD